MFTLEDGLASPLGASPREGGVNFALFSAHASSVDLCLFDDEDVEFARLPLTARTGDVFHGFVPGLSVGQRYGYRVHGDWNPAAGDRFNANKLLIDPYARALSGTVVWNDALFAYERGHPDADLSFDTRDSAPFMPKCIVASPLTRRGHQRPRHKPAERVIYEGHVKGLTKRFPGMVSSRQGSYTALSSRKFLRYLQDLGVTTLELLPVHGFVNDEFLIDKGLVNYWGYQTLTFMAPEARYALGHDAVREFADAVKAIHAAGIEVFLDVVYNHTCEGNELGPHLSFRGIDNRSYYRLLENQRYYVNDTGTGNTLAVDHPRVLQLIMDSLRFWYSEMKVDGFRFDLATVLGREAHGFDRGAGFFDALHQDPALAEASLIAEPWDIGPGGYQLGQYPTHWGEWNDRFRDTTRRFWVRREPELPALADCLLGSGGVFDQRHRAPQASINFVTAHDGSTLMDLVSYDTRRNEANGESNRDGHSHEITANHGVEGPSEDPDITARRARTRRNLMASLMLSQGTPMLLAGDEFGRTQAGNNNAYCQDNELTWLDWRVLSAPSGARAAAAVVEARAFLAFTRRLIALRHDTPVLCQKDWLHGRHTCGRFGLPETSWLRENGSLMTDTDWHGQQARAVALQLLCSPTVEASPGASDPILIVINGLDRAWQLSLSGPAVAPVEWQIVLDTSDPEGSPPEDPQVTANTGLAVQPESIVVARCYN